MQKPLKLTLCAVIAAAALLGATGCGEDRSNLLPGDTVAEISANLDTVNDLYQSGECFQAIDAADQIKTQVLNLGPNVDEKLKKNLDDGVNELVVTIRSGCTETGTTATTGDTSAETEVTPSDSTGTTGTTDTTSDQSTDTTSKDKGKGKVKPSKPETTPTPTPEPEPTTPVTPEPDPVTPPTTPPETGGVGPGT